MKVFLCVLNAPNTSYKDVAVVLLLLDYYRWTFFFLQSMVCKTKGFHVASVDLRPAKGLKKTLRNMVETLLC